jgi:hypothetical protein
VRGLALYDDAFSPRDGSGFIYRRRRWILIRHKCDAGWKPAKEAPRTSAILLVPRIDETNLLKATIRKSFTGEFLLLARTDRDESELKGNDRGELPKPEAALAWPLAHHAVPLRLRDRTYRARRQERFLNALTDANAD